jgi:hypothetical protein
MEGTMLKFLALILVTLLALGNAFTVPANTDEPLSKADAGKKEEAKKTPDLSLGELALEVQALRLLRTLNFSSDQFKQMEKLAKDAAMPARQRKGKASAEFRKLLSSLRDALAMEEEDSIDTLSEQLDQLNESEKPELDDGVESTEAARKAVPELLKHMKVTQYVAYVVLISDQVVDPADELKEKLGKVRQLTLAEWKEQRDEVGDGVAKLLAGIDTKKAEKVREKVLTVLNQARTLKDEEYEKKRPDLEKEIDDLVNEIGPGQIVKHLFELALADLLSNPRLPAALEARKALAAKDK